MDPSTGTGSGSGIWCFWFPTMVSVPSKHLDGLHLLNTIGSTPFVAVAAGADCCLMSLGGPWFVPCLATAGNSPASINMEELDKRTATDCHKPPAIGVLLKTWLFMMTNSDYTIYFGCSPMLSLCGSWWLLGWPLSLKHWPYHSSANQSISKKAHRRNLWNCEIWTCIWHKAVPIGSMYAIYGNIYHQYTPNVSIYTIHGSYGVAGCHMLSYVVIKLDIKHWSVIKYDGISPCICRAENCRCMLLRIKSH